jgi:hypothetical protein
MEECLPENNIQAEVRDNADKQVINRPSKKDSSTPCVFQSNDNLTIDFNENNEDLDQDDSEQMHHMPR